MPSREPLTTCPSPLHFTGSLTCRLGRTLCRGRKTKLLPDPGYVALTNICREDGGCCPVKKDPPGHSSKKSCQNPIKKMSPKSPAAMFSCLDINTKKRLILLCSSEFSGVQCATLEVA